MIHSPEPCGASGASERPPHEVAQIVRDHAGQLRPESLSAEQRQVLAAIAACRTAALGGHVQLCAACGHRQPQYNSCRNRHCPKCQSLAQHRWLEARKVRILPVHHFHVVFTLPAELRPLVLRNRRALYALLFEAASQSLLELGLDPKRLGGLLGVTAVLHTWTRDLTFHPHLHCVVTGGGLRPKGDRWMTTRPGFLFPVRVLAALFRGKYLDGVRALHDRGALHLSGGWQCSSDPHAFETCLDKLYRKRWLVYSKPPFGGADAVYAYLGRYTHRVGISNARLLHVGPNCVRFRTRHQRQATLSSIEFLRRLMLHVLPKGFVRIRHFGLLAPANVSTRLATSRSLLNAVSRQAQSAPAREPPVLADADRPSFVRQYQRLTGIDLLRCPSCGQAEISLIPIERAARGPP